MIDLHAHVLPGLDHGARDWGEAVEMCRIAVADGIRTLAATPHVSESFPNRRERIEEAVAELRSRLAADGVPLEIVAGGDYHAHPDLAPENVLTLGGNGRYFLLEFPYQALPPGADAFIRLLAGRGLTPIVTHPERTASLQREWRRLERLVRAGALVQLTAGSLLGHFGPLAAETASRFLREGWAHLLASDAHWARERVPRLAEGRAAAARLVGQEAAAALVDAHPRAVLAGKDVPGAAHPLPPAFPKGE
ncbi:MAG TPA: CpsB/CapC family capsule biosynthesis tyrosine phosphatase [Candidatus Methanoperedens sp.]|nr:CpsB/CapC family capsule biosynthesis tyrosine phosphatase [Candidatus Methanoperedens sp.]